MAAGCYVWNGIHQRIIEDLTWDRDELMEINVHLLEFLNSRPWMTGPFAVALVAFVAVVVRMPLATNDSRTRQTAMSPVGRGRRFGLFDLAHGCLEGVQLGFSAIFLLLFRLLLLLSLPSALLLLLLFHLGSTLGHPSTAIYWSAGT